MAALRVCRGALALVPPSRSGAVREYPRSLHLAAVLLAPRVARKPEHQRIWQISSSVGPLGNCAPRARPRPEITEAPSTGSGAGPLRDRRHSPLNAIATAAQSCGRRAPLDASRPSFAAAFARLLPVSPPSLRGGHARATVARLLSSHFCTENYSIFAD